MVPFDCIIFSIRIRTSVCLNTLIYFIALGIFEMKNIIVLLFLLSVNTANAAEPFPEELFKAISEVVRTESPWCYEKAIEKCEMQFFKYYKHDEAFHAILTKKCEAHIAETKITKEQHLTCRTHWASIMDRIEKEVREKNK
jgi:hypothetical protein